MAFETTGRPKAKLDWEKIDELLVAGCSGAEIASFFGLNKATIYDRCLTDKGIPFSEYSQRKYEKGDSLIRKAQFNKALDGDNTMLVWLGKNRLKQRDKQPEEIDNNITIKVIDARNHSTEELSVQTLPECGVDSNAGGV